LAYFTAANSPRKSIAASRAKKLNPQRISSLAFGRMYSVASRGLTVSEQCFRINVQTGG
jgi:hypothetical protein